MGKEAPGSSKEAPGRLRGGSKVAMFLWLAPYVVTTLLPTKTEVSEDLTRRCWARGPADILDTRFQMLDFRYSIIVFSISNFIVRLCICIIRCQTSEFRRSTPACRASIGEA